jgi:hypothetical protein
MWTEENEFKPFYEITGSFPGPEVSKHRKRALTSPGAGTGLDWAGTGLDCAGTGLDWAGTGLDWAGTKHRRLSVNISP